MLSFWPQAKPSTCLAAEEQGTQIHHSSWACVLHTHWGGERGKRRAADRKGIENGRQRQPEAEKEGVLAAGQGKRHPMPFAELQRL